MTPVLTFFIGLAILVLFGWYFATESERLRRILGTVLTSWLRRFAYGRLIRRSTRSDRTGR